MRSGAASYSAAKQHQVANSWASATLRVPMAMQATVEISREHSDFFVRNMVAILAEERLAQVVYNAEALVTGSYGSPW